MKKYGNMVKKMTHKLITYVGGENRRLMYIREYYFHIVPEIKLDKVLEKINGVATKRKLMAAEKNLLSKGIQDWLFKISSAPLFITEQGSSVWEPPIFSPEDQLQIEKLYLFNQI